MVFRKLNFRLLTDHLANACCCAPSAYEVLIDEEKRRIYDQYGEEGLKDSGQQFHDPFDIFSQ